MYRVQLSDFEGPLDLLLFFIRRDELDVYDIPIARITDEYLTYVRDLSDVDLDSVGDFIYMASLLISIKAKMLLPKPEVDADGEEVNPRAELVERLVEYMRYKEASETLGALLEDRQRYFTRGAAADTGVEALQEIEPELDVSLVSLVRALQSILTTADEEEVVHAVERIEYTTEMQQHYLLDELAVGQPRSFRQLVQGEPKTFIIATFLAVLELARQRVIAIYIDEDGFDFSVERQAEAAEAAEPGTPGSVERSGLSE